MLDPVWLSVFSLVEWWLIKWSYWKISTWETCLSVVAPERWSELKALLATLFKINTALCNDVPGRPECSQPSTALLEYSRIIAAWDCLGATTANYQGGGGTKTGPLLQSPGIYKYVQAPSGTSWTDYQHSSLTLWNAISPHTFCLIAVERLAACFKYFRR